MRHAGLCGSGLFALLLASAVHAQGGAPLDVSDPTSRSVFVQVESSSSPGTVGQTFGPVFPATWTVSGNTGTLTISIATHEQMRSDWLTPVPGTFTPIEIQIDLTTLHVTSLPNSGYTAEGGSYFQFDQQTLRSDTIGGYVAPSGPPLFCASQADVDLYCSWFGLFCGQGCALVPGHAYDPASGLANLVGIEHQGGCHEGYCFSAAFFAQRGDLRFTEAVAVVPALPLPAASALAALLVGLAAALAPRRRFERVALFSALLPAVAHAQGGAPLDVSDPTSRSVYVQVESSSSPGTVGQTFGPVFPATWTASGNTGTLTISIATHEQMRSGGYTPIPGSFTPIVIEIDRTTLEATSQAASGQAVSGQVQFGFSTSPLGTTATAGYTSGGNLPPLFCTSQAQLDQLCQIAPQYCGATCNIVPGHAYEPATGEINLVGSEAQYGCDGSFCQGPFDMFTARGDLRLTEAAEIPALPGLAPLALFALLVAAARRPTSVGRRAARRSRAKAGSPSASE